MAAIRNVPLTSMGVCIPAPCQCTWAHPPAGEVLVLRHLINLEPGQTHSTVS